MKLAWFSPLTPQRSGISDYSEELLPHLAAGAEITLFVDGFQPANGELVSRFEVLDYRRQRSLLQKLSDFDAVIYHMGNDHRYHAGIFEAMKRRSGIVVFHDFALQDFFLGLARDTRDVRVYLDEVENCHGASARAEAAEELARGATPAIVSRPVEFPLNCRLAKSAEGIIVHSEWSRARFSTIAPPVPITRIPMPIKFSDAARKVERSNDEVRIASFGLITPGKGIEAALRALQKLKQSHRFRYTLVGESNSFYDVRSLIRQYDMEDRVEITGHVSLDEFKRHIDETDIALNIRERTVGETSASLCRLMAAGVCAIVADDGWYAELPNDAVVKVPLDAFTDKLLLAYLARLIEDESLRRQIGQNARRFGQAEHAVDKAAAAYLSFINEVIAKRMRRHLVASVTEEIAHLEIRASDEFFLRGVAQDVTTIAPPTNSPHAKTIIAKAAIPRSNGKEAPGRMRKIEGLDYKQAAREYPAKLDAERRHYLLTKPFYNLANKPPKHGGDGMDAETFRHFCDFANIAVTLGLPAGARILDVGCGSGWLSEYFARLGYVVKGIDISADLIAMSRERIAKIAFDVDHKTPLRCTFEVHDVELSPLAEKFDAIICYDSLHHFEDEQAMVRHLSQMLDVGGLLFILEGDRPQTGSATEAELTGVMHEFGTLESPFDYSYLRELLDRNGFAVVGDYTSVNGLFEREILEDDRLPLATLPTNYYYLTCKKVAEDAPASSILDSRTPGLLKARIALRQPLPERFACAEKMILDLEIENVGDTLWLASHHPRAGIVMPAVRVFDEAGTLVDEFHGQPALPRAVAPGETVRLKIDYAAPRRAGRYQLKIDLVCQHVCWFEEHGSKPLVIPFKVAQTLVCDEP